MMAALGGTLEEFVDGAGDLIWGTDGQGSSTVPPTATGSSSGTPGAVPFRPGHWNASTAPAEYVIAEGDTMVGIAARYLGAGARWTEIGALQTHTENERGPNGPYLNWYTSVWSPSHIKSRPGGAWFRPGAALVMPDEALAKAIELAKDPSVIKGANQSGAPGAKPPGYAPPPLETAPAPGGAGTNAGMSLGMKVGIVAALGVGAAAVFLGGRGGRT